MNKIITRGFGTGSFRYIPKGYGGLVYKLKAWATVFKKELLDWAIKAPPNTLFERESINNLFKSLSRSVGFSIIFDPITIEKNPKITEIEKLAMDYVSIRHTEITSTFSHEGCDVKGIDIEGRVYEVVHPGTNTLLDHVEVTVEVKEFIKYLEI